MIKLKFVRDKTYIIVGFGKTGLSTAFILQANGAEVLVHDDNPDKLSQAQDLGYKVYESHNCDWKQVTALILSPGIPHRLPQPHFLAELAQINNIPIICDIDLLAQAYPDAYYYGITGTNGKSTTSALMFHQLKALGLNVYLGGNIGHPVLQFNIIGEKPVFVLELSSYQLERVPHLKVQTAIWLNISPDHLDRHGNMEGYLKAKQHLFAPFAQAQHVVIGTNDPYSLKIYNVLIQDRAKNCIMIPPLHNSFCHYSTFHHSTLKGLHNHQNIMAVYMALKINKLEFDPYIFGLFTGLPHRQEYCGSIKGVTYINDSKATNYDSTKTLLNTYSKLHLILGGVAKAGGIEQIAAYKDHLIQCYLIGQTADQFAAQLTQDRISYTICHTLENAVNQIFINAKPGEIAALSPACASFDQFKSFEHRGDRFKQFVNQLSNRILA